MTTYRGFELDDTRPEEHPGHMDGIDAQLDSYDDIGHERAEARQQAAEDGIMWLDDDPEYDALMDAALDERFALPTWEAACEARRLAMPPVLDGVAW